MSEQDILDLLEIPEHLETNTDLGEFANREPPAATPRNDTGGPCHLCQTHARRGCVRCERPACTSHHHVMYGLCHACVSDAKNSDEEVLQDRPRNLDIPWVE
jgi:hypothetical protein